jgi:hypothetical protein
MHSYLTSKELVEAIERGAFVPSSQNTFQTKDYLAFANEEMRIGIIPSVLMHHQEHYCRDSEKIKILPNKSAYSIPSRAIAGRIRDIIWMDENGNMRTLSRINFEDRPYHNGIGSSVCSYYYLQGNDIVLVPKVGHNSNGYLVISYYLRPNILVEMSRVAWIESIEKRSLNGVISAISVGTPTVIESVAHGLNSGDFIQVSGSNCTPSMDGFHQVDVVDANFFLVNLNLTLTSPGTFGLFQHDVTVFTVDQVPSNLQVAQKIDVMQTEGSHKTLCLDQKPLFVDSFSRQITFFTPSLGSDEIVEGDYLAEAGQCVIPQAPDELHDVLAQRVIGRVLQAQGDQTGFENVNTRLNEMEAKTRTLISNRTEGDPLKVINRNSLIRLNRFWRS